MHYGLLCPRNPSSARIEALEHRPTLIVWLGEIWYSCRQLRLGGREGLGSCMARVWSSSGRRPALPLARAYHSDAAKLGGRDGVGQRVALAATLDLQWRFWSCSYRSGESTESERAQSRTMQRGTRRGWGAQRRQLAERRSWTDGGDASRGLTFPRILLEVDRGLSGPVQSQHFGPRLPQAFALRLPGPSLESPHQPPPLDSCPLSRISCFSHHSWPSRLPRVEISRPFGVWGNDNAKELRVQLHLDWIAQRRLARIAPMPLLRHLPLV